MSQNANDNTQPTTSVDELNSDPDFVDTELADTSQYADAPADPRELLRQKIEAGRQRLAERDLANAAKEAAENAAEFTKKHPIAVVAGAIGVGLLIGAMTRPGRTVVKTGAKRGSAFAALATQAALSFGLDLLERAEESAAKAKQKGGDMAEDIGESIGTTARGIKRDASYRADAASDAVKTASRKAKRTTSRTVRDLRSRLNG